MSDMPLDVDKQALPGGNTNAPSSGTYGEKAGIDSLKRSLPEMAPPGGPGGGPPPMNPGQITPTPDQGGRPPASAPGLPGALVRPTDMPGTPVGTPLSEGPDMLGGEMPPVDDHFEGRLITIDLLAQDPRVSPETREWAQQVRAILVGGDPV